MRTLTVAHALALALAGSTAGCHDTEVVVGELAEITSLRAIPNRDLDLLFVVDNSGSMAEQQASLAANFPRMMDALAQLDGGLPNLHIGVVTSDLGTSAAAGQPAPPVGTLGNGGCASTGEDGVLRTTPGLTGNFISDVAFLDGSRDRNYTGALRDVFASLAQVGAGGCGFEQHLGAMRRALVHPANAGFLRPGANLAVVIIADEDDCSALDPALFGADPSVLGPLTSFRCTRYGVACDPDDPTTPGAKTGCVPRADSTLVEDVQPFVDALLAVKADPREVLVAGIVGDPEPVVVEQTTVTGTPAPALQPSCTFAGPGGPEYADPAVRLAAFLDAFPGRSQRTSICNADLSTALAEIGATAKKLVGDPCLDSDLFDASPEPGLQPACEVVDIRDSDPTPVPVPACSLGATDCFQIAADPAACPDAPEHLRVTFRRSAVADDTWTHVRCQLAR